jgi:hypothetical protein
MNLPLRPLLLPLVLWCGFAHAAAPAAWLGTADCRVAPVMPRPSDDAISWSGACKDGYADGKGVLEWRATGKDKRRLEATLVRGEVTGEGTLSYREGDYTGTFRQGLPHGAGYFKYTNGDGLYEGGVVEGVREGAGMQVELDRSTYEGQWKAGKRHGAGKAVFTLGGSYEGEWRDDKFNGRGKIVYGGSGRTWSGEFRNGRAADAAPAPLGEPERFALKADHPTPGSHIRPDSAIGAVPPDAAWAELTPAQQAVVRDSYPALDDRDEPPYPHKGTRAYLKAIADLYAKFTHVQGDALVYVVVGADGVPTSANTYGAPHADLGRYLSMIGMMQRFKPARCAGTPCAMIYPVKFRFSVD